MVATKPRFGGGSRMEIKDTQVIGSPQRETATPINMDNPRKHIPGARAGMPDFRPEEEKENEIEASGIDQWTENEHTTVPSTEENLWPADDKPLLRFDEICNEISDDSSSLPAKGEVNDIKAKSSTPDSGSFGDNGETNQENPTVHQDRTVSEDASGDFMKNAIAASRDNEEINGGQGHLKANLTRLRQLLDIFETLGIQRKVKLYTKLKDDEKILWSPLFQECLGNVFSPASESLDNLDVIYCKNLFLKDRKGQFYLLIAEDSYTVDLKQLKLQLNAARNLSFATEDDLMKILQIKPGEVSPLTIMQESARPVRVILHHSLNCVRKSCETFMAFHPFSPLLQVDIIFSELASFMTYNKKELEMLSETKHGASPTTSEFILKEESSNTTGGQVVSNSLVKRGARPKLDHTERKGKLKSYIKKNESRKTIKSDEDNAKFGSQGSMTVDNGKAPTKNSESEVMDVLRPGNMGKSTNLDHIAPTKRLPEVDDFYNTLSLYQIDYSEFTVSSETSKEIGPALGARCFLLKDKRQNYFVIISHEFYELDYGRLKKSLHPKKKLDVCDISDLPLILGVDFQHFTPFAVMNERARMSNVQVFFTEKIIHQNIVLCVQHPFASGHRIVLKSSELQRLLQSFSSNSCIGVVEEKAWLKKYNQAFSQFTDNESKHSQLDKRVMDIHNPPTGQRRSQSEDSDEGANGNMECQKSPKYAKSPQLDANRQIIIDNRSSYINLFSRAESMFSFLLNHSCRIMRRLTLKTPSSFSSNVDSSRFDLRSSVDAMALSEIYENSPERMKKHQENDSDTCVTDFVERNDTFVQENVKIKDTQSEPIFDVKDSVQDFCKKLEVLLVSDDKLKHHLDQYGICYVLKKSNVARFGDGMDNGNCNDDICENGDDNDDSTTQICHTLHLTDESGSQHYFVVGRYSEQISVKRFRRRFQIKNRLFIVNGMEKESHLGDSLKNITMTNPFLAIQHMMESIEDQKRNATNVKCLMVLFSSIYMEPDMTCQFPLDTTGTRYLCMTSQELENYAKRVGVEIWYMP